MKNFRFSYKSALLALCCTLFVACETNTIKEQNPISFGSGRNQAAGSGYNALLWGYHGDTWDFAGTTTDGLTAGENATVGLVDETLVLTPSSTRYWADTESKYNFYAVYFQSGNAATVSNERLNKSTGELTFSYGNIAEQCDLCIASALNQEGGYTRNTPVALNFQHMLSKVKFVGSSIGVDATLTDLTITVPQSANGTYTSAGVVYNLTGSTSLTTPDGEIAVPVSPATPINGEGWLVFPQSFTDASKITISVTYKLSDTQTETRTATLPITTITEWQPGKVYTYNFSVQPLGPIVFGETVTVSDWEDDATNSGNLSFDITP